VYHEEDFVADFLQINDAALTFADYMGMENYYRRQAARTVGLSPATAKLVRGGMDFIFGFLPHELKVWIDVALAKDSLYGSFVAIRRIFLLMGGLAGNWSELLLRLSASWLRQTSVAMRSLVICLKSNTRASKPSLSGTL
jgi:hypothetical protein